MDCSVCTSMPVQLRPPRNTICGACYEGARSLISFINKLETAQGIDKANLCKASSANFIFLFIFTIYYFQKKKPYFKTFVINYFG